MAEKIGWEDGADVTEEDIIAALKPLVDEYFFGEAEDMGNRNEVLSARNG